MDPTLIFAVALIVIGLLALAAAVALEAIARRPR
jgi:hypothetical protein